MTYALETQIENLRAEVNRLNNVIGERDWEIQRLRLAERFAFEAAREQIINKEGSGFSGKVIGSLTKLKYIAFDDYQRSKSQEGQS